MLKSHPSYDPLTEKANSAQKSAGTASACTSNKIVIVLLAFIVLGQALVCMALLGVSTSISAASKALDPGGMFAYFFTCPNSKLENQMLWF
jgi:hypothetical protein